MGRITDRCFLLVVQSGDPVHRVVPPYSEWVFWAEQTSPQTPIEHTQSCVSEESALQADGEDEEGIIGRFLAARLLPPNITSKVEERDGVRR